MHQLHDVRYCSRSCLGRREDKGPPILERLNGAETDIQVGALTCLERYLIKPNEEVQAPV
jgi:hypothetical protein